MTLDVAKAAFENYHTLHRKPGGFLTAVLCNDLGLAVRIADPESLQNLKAIVLQATEMLPDWAHGTPEKVAAHLAAKPETETTP